MIKLIVSDIDGTLIKKSYKTDPYFVDEDNFNAIHKAKDNGIVFALATGRNHASAEFVMKKLKFKTHIISQNGTYLINDKNKQISKNAFKPEETISCIATLTQHEIDYMISGPNTVAFDTFGKNKLTPYIIDSNSGRKLLISDKLLREFDQHAHRVGTITAIPNEDHDFEEIENLLREQIDNSKFNVVQSSQFTVDITLKDISKASAILQLCEQLLITPDEVAVIGDNFNDLPMFKVFKHSYVMSEANPKLKRYAKHEVDSVAQAINHAMGVK